MDEEKLKEEKNGKLYFLSNSLPFSGLYLYEKAILLETRFFSIFFAISKTKLKYFTSSIISINAHFLKS